MLLLLELYLFGVVVHRELKELSFLSKGVDAVVEIVASNDVVPLNQRWVVQQQRGFHSVYKVVAGLRH